MADSGVLVPEVGFWQAPCTSQMGYKLAASPGISRQWRSQGTQGTTPTMEVINIVPRRPALLSGASSEPRPGRHLVDAAHVTLLPTSEGAGSIVTAHTPPGPVTTPPACLCCLTSQHSAPATLSCLQWL